MRRGVGDDFAIDKLPPTSPRRRPPPWRLVDELRVSFRAAFPVTDSKRHACRTGCNALECAYADIIRASALQVRFKNCSHSNQW